MIGRRRIRIRGTVQGVGFRPHVYRQANEHHVAGWVSNTSDGVFIEAEAELSTLDAFADAVVRLAPPLAVVEDVEVSEQAPAGDRSFEIRASLAQPGQFVPISPDIATCADCLREVNDPADRRLRYPFTNCTNCGPRFTIVADIPYDRPLTTMRDFPLCPDCAREYDDPADRRFHAQPTACPRCGPRLALLDRDGTPLPLDDLDPTNPSGAAIRAAARSLADGRVLAIRGLGGFHLACDATNEAAVALLRDRKRRVGKPFALMSPDLETVGLYAGFDESERQLLESPARPIVLLARRHVAARFPVAGSLAADRRSAIAASVAPASRSLGVMLPYTPLHHLLLDEFARLVSAPAALVMTSGNLSEEPIATGNAEAIERLRDLADLFLVHDREIETRCDDSVARVFRGRPTILRRSRGYAPAPIRLRRDLGSLLACGAELKNTFCLTRGRHAFLGPHVGDLENYETFESYRGLIDHMERLFRVAPEALVHDLHPDYLSTQYARDRVAASGGRLRLVGVQHHEAHVASAMVENFVDGPVIGVAFDGTGYGTDGAIWGGEFFVGDYAGFVRRAHLGYVRLPGGDLAIRRPARTALSYLRAAFCAELDDLPIELLGRLPTAERRAVEAQLTTGLNAPLTSSAGRLFDAVAAVLDVRDAVSYEGQAAIELENLADSAVTDGYDWPAVVRDGALVLDPAALVRRVVEDHLAGTPRPVVAARFHNAVAMAVAEVCGALRRESGLDRVCLSGGVFQNAFLLGRAIDALEAAGFRVYTQRLVPPNDGGIALGQAAIAAARLDLGG